VKSGYVTDLHVINATNSKGIKFSTSETRSDASVQIFCIKTIYSKKVINRDIGMFAYIKGKKGGGRIRTNDSSSGATRSELKRMCVTLLLDASSLNSLGNTRGRGEQQ